MVWWSNRRIGLGEYSGEDGYIFRPGLLHEIDDIAILGANGRTLRQKARAEPSPKKLGVALDL